MELYLGNVACKDAFSAPGQSSEAHSAATPSNSCAVLEALQPLLSLLPAGKAAVQTLTLLNNSALPSFMICTPPQCSETTPVPRTVIFTSSVPTPARDECHQKCWVNVIYTRWFLRRSLRTALVIIRRFTVVYHKFFNLHKSLNDGDNPEVHFSILKVTKNCWSDVTCNYFCHFSCF